MLALSNWRDAGKAPNIRSNALMGVAATQRDSARLRSVGQQRLPADAEIQEILIGDTPTAFLNIRRK